MLTTVIGILLIVLTIVLFVVSCDYFRLYKILNKKYQNINVLTPEFFLNLDIVRAHKFDDGRCLLIKIGRMHGVKPFGNGTLSINNIGGFLYILRNEFKIVEVEYFREFSDAIEHAQNIHGTVKWNLFDGEIVNNAELGKYIGAHQQYTEYRGI